MKYIEKRKKKTFQFGKHLLQKKSINLDQTIQKKKSTKTVDHPVSFVNEFILWWEGPPEPRN